MSDGVRVLTEAEAVNRESARRRAAARAERRKEIVKAVLPVVTTYYIGQQVAEPKWRYGIAHEAVRIADEVMARLDAAEARDAEAA